MPGKWVAEKQFLARKNKNVNLYINGHQCAFYKLCSLERKATDTLENLCDNFLIIHNFKIHMQKRFSQKVLN